MAEPAIRDAGVEDCKGIVALVSAYDVECGRMPDAASAHGAALACIDLPEHDLIVAAIDGAIVGYAAVHWVPFPMIGGCEGYVSDLLVRADWRGRGVGTRLLKEIDARAKALGGSRIMLNVRIGGDAFQRRFYERSGFRRRDDFANLTKTIGA